MHEIKIRIANRSDLKTVTKYYHSLYYGDEKQKFYSSKILPKNFRSGQFLLVATIDKKVFGYIWIIWYEHIKHKGVGYIEELFVDKKSRKRHLGMTLVDEAKKLLQLRNINIIYFAVGKHMTESQNFYKEIGACVSNELWFEINF